MIAHITGIYGLYLFLTNPVKTPKQVICTLIGGICGIWGEYTQNLPLYTFLHTIWHGLAYYSLHLVNH
jgi:hypothetical protein